MAGAEPSRAEAVVNSWDKDSGSAGRHGVDLNLVVSMARERRDKCAIDRRIALKFALHDSVDPWELDAIDEGRKRNVKFWGIVRCQIDSLLDRLLHHAHIVQIAQDSYRLKEKRKAENIKIRN